MKKYLNSVEEVVKALKEGQKLFESFKSGDTEQIKEITLIDGIICTKDDIGYGIHLLSACKYYTEEPEPIKFEVNKPYKVKCGQKVFISFKLENTKSYGIVSSIGFYCVDYNGKELLGEDKWDIVGYWEEEK